MLLTNNMFCAVFKILFYSFNIKLIIFGNTKILKKMKLIHNSNMFLNR